MNNIAISFDLLSFLVISGPSSTSITTLFPGHNEKFRSHFQCDICELVWFSGELFQDDRRNVLPVFLSFLRSFSGSFFNTLVIKQKCSYCSPWQAECSVIGLPAQIHLYSGTFSTVLVVTSRPRRSSSSTSSRSSENHVCHSKTRTRDIVLTPNISSDILHGISSCVARLMS